MADSATLKLKLVIPPEDLGFLKEAKLNIGFARDIEDDGKEQEGNVIFAMAKAEDLEPNMSFKWQDKYQIFEAAPAGYGQKITANTTVLNVEEGHRAVFEPGPDGGCGMVGGATRPGAPFTVTNEWMPAACIGVNGYDANTLCYATFYASPNVDMNTNKKLRPIKKFAVFVTPEAEIGTKFYNFDFPAFRFDFNSSNEVTLEYAGRFQWRIRE